MADGAQHTPATPIPITGAPAPTKLSTLSTLSTLNTLSTPASQPRFASVASVASTHAQPSSAAVMSPVNQNGCFEFDRIIKAGPVLKRTRKTKVRHAHDAVCTAPPCGMLSCTAMEAYPHRPTPELPVHLQ